MTTILPPPSKPSYLTAKLYPAQIALLKEFSSYADEALAETTFLAGSPRPTRTQKLWTKIKGFFKKN
jgi:hypothetical protein